MNKRITVSYDIVTEESARDGDVDERGWIDEDGVNMMPDEIDLEDGLSSVDLAVDYLEDRVLEPSSSSFHSGIWYIGHPDIDMSTGGETTYYYHLKDFTESEEKEIFKEII